MRYRMSRAEVDYRSAPYSTSCRICQAVVELLVSADSSRSRGHTSPGRWSATRSWKCFESMPGKQQCSVRSYACTQLDGLRTPALHLVGLYVIRISPPGRGPGSMRVLASGCGPPVSNLLAARCLEDVGCLWVEHGGGDCNAQNHEVARPEKFVHDGSGVSVRMWMGKWELVLRLDRTIDG